MRHFIKKHAWAAGFSICLLAFTVYLALDTFVLSSVYQTDATEVNLAMVREAQAQAQAEASTGAGEDGAAAAQASGNEEGGGESGQSSSENNSQKKTSSGSSSGSENSSGNSERSGSPGSGSSHKKPGSGGTGGKKSFRSSGSTASFDEEAAAASAAQVTTENASAAGSYEDDNIQISYQTYTTNGTTVHVADVQLSSVEYLKTAFASDTYGKNVTQSTSDMAEANNAVLAINGDYYGVQESGYVIRNGVVYRDKAGTNDVLCIYADGSMKVIDPSAATAQELVDQGVWQAFSFGPGLVEDGEVAVSLSTEVGKAMASNPRTAIGMIDPLHYVFVVSDGRSDESEGLSLYELASFMQQLGAETAYNLDGGGSSTMVFQGNVVNDPAGGFGDREREVSDIVYIG